MNHYVNGITNLSMSEGVITFNFVNIINSDNGEKKVEDEVRISMPGSTFNGLMNICNDFIDKVKENAEKLNQVEIEEPEEEIEKEATVEETTPKKRGRAKKQ